MARHLGPDFLNTGDRVLEGLELGSEFTWELAHEGLKSAMPRLKLTMPG